MKHLFFKQMLTNICSSADCTGLGRRDEDGEGEGERDGDAGSSSENISGKDSSGGSSRAGPALPHNENHGRH